jgi:hypothetical protein
MNEIEFLIENNYADTSEAAKKILESASDEFYEYVVCEGKKTELLKKIATKAVKYSAKKVLNSKPMQSATRFVKYTALGGLVP